MSEVIASTIGYGVRGMRFIAIGQDDQPVALDPKNITIDLAHGVIAAVSVSKMVECGVKKIVFTPEGENVNAQAIQVIFIDKWLVDIHPPNKGA